MFFAVNTVYYSDNKSEVKRRNFEVHNEPNAAAAFHHANIKKLMAFIKDDLACMSLASNGSL